MRRARLAYAAAAALTGLCSPGMAQTPAEFYKANKFVIVVGLSPGGGYDLYARLLSRHIGRHIPGSPAVIVQNAPGAGSLTAVRRMEGNLPKDGTTLVTFNPFLITTSMFTPEKIGIDFRNVAWVGSIMRNSTFCFAWHTTGVKTWDDLLKREEFVVGATNRGTGSYSHSAMLKNLFGVKIRQILGFPGSAEQQLAMERGELDGECGAWTSVPPEMLRDKKIYPLVRFTPVIVPGMPKDMPYAGDLATTDEQKAILDIITAPGELGRPFIMSGSVPQDRLAAVRSAFDATTNDKAFLGEAEKLQMPLSIVGAAEATAIVNRINAFPRALVEKAAKVVE
jgi:tripartite-type tricarboxylate transporter receptor subunit TctC